MSPRPILCFGEALTDLHASGIDSHGFAAGFTPFAGGETANVAVAVARLGGTARFAGMLADDPFGDFLLASLQQANVVKLSVEEFAWLAVDGEQAVLDRLWLGRARLLVVTDGDEVRAFMANQT